MFKIFGKITDSNIEDTIQSKVDFDNIDTNLSYELKLEFYNKDLEEDMLNDDVSYEIKKEHYIFIKKLRNLFESKNININKLYLMGTIVDLQENEMNLSILKSKYENKKNIVWPCKEVFLFEDRKNKLDLLLTNNQISEEDYESNLEFLKDELNIYDNDEEHMYIN